MLTTSAAAQEAPPNPKLVPPAPLHEQILHLSGDPDRPVNLVVTVYTPMGTGPFPLAVINHGANGSSEKPAEMQRYRFTMAAYYFLSRGYAVALPMMRGYAGSGGAQTNHGCDLPEIALDNGRDIAGLIASLAADPHIDTSRVVVAGQSFGGWNTLGLGALQPDHVRGLISFSGGVKSTACIDERIGYRALIQGAQRFGANTQIPSIWFFGDNDSLFPKDVWRGMHQVYTQAGASAELVDIGSFMNDSHQMLSYPEGIALLAPKLDAFLQRIGLPHTEVQPAYMPTPTPPPTHFAALEDIGAVPWVNAQSRANYAQFLTAPLPRAFVIAPGGQSASAHDGFDPLSRALALCTQAGLACVPYAVDRTVVFVKPAG